MRKSGSRRLGIGTFALMLAVMLILPAAAFAAPVRIENTEFHYNRADGTPADIAPWPGPATWMTYADPSMSGGGNHFSGTTGAFAAVEFTGTDVTFISTKGPNRGLAEIWLDGEYQATVNEYDPAVIYQQELWSKSGMPPGTHTLRVVALGTGAPPYNYAEIDAIEVDTVVVESAASSAWSLAALAIAGMGAVLIVRRRLAH